MKSASCLEEVLKEYFAVEKINLNVVSVGGGDIHSSFQLNLGGDDKLPPRLFAKLNSRIGADILRTEFQSLEILNSLTPKLYPQTLLFDDSQAEAVLIMQFHNLISLNSSNAADAGRALAEHHKMIHDQFGWTSNNYIGMTPQSNHWSSNWVEFFREQRLMPMLENAKRKGLCGVSVSKVNDIISHLGKLLSHKVTPSLVHGDLWSGNLGFDTDISKPLFYDPAPYYGDREVDIAMTNLFGRQPDAFYQAYEKVWPLERGYENRQAVYNLYHALNHVVLFGSSYNSLVDDCLNEILL